VKEPLVTICVPTFNATATLDRCFEGVRLQHADDIEILVVDNCSTDGSAERAERTLADLPRVRIVRNPSNLGRIENWNRGLELATGRYLKFIMASDVLWRGALSCLLEHALANPQAVVVSSQHEPWTGDERPIPSVAPTGSVRHMDGLTVLGLVADGQNPFWAMNGMLIRREPALTHGLRFVPEIPYLSDLHFCGRLAAFGDTLFVETPTYWFNTSVSGRFHYKGLDPERYLPEARRLYADLGAVRQSLGGGPPDVYRSLLRNFTECVRRGVLAPGPGTTFRLFAGAPLSYRLRAAAASTVARPLERVRQVRRRAAHAIRETLRHRTRTS
jgi:GT2 family glycosyltransferase